MTTADAPLTVFALRYALETVPQAREAILRIVRHRIKQGTSPLERMAGKTPLAVVWDLLGEMDPWTTRFAEVLLEFFQSQTVQWTKGVRVVALLGGWDVSGITNWADAVEVEEICEGFDFNFPAHQ